jgi:hypothetical protein
MGCENRFFVVGVVSVADIQFCEVFASCRRRRPGTILVGVAR